MQIFLPFVDVLETAKCLDWRRLNKQIIECNQIIAASNNASSRVRNHPIFKMYRNHMNFVSSYVQVLYLYRANLLDLVADENIRCTALLPQFLEDQQWYFDNFKKRLYTKDKNYYRCFEGYGESNSNFYYVEGEWVEYKS